MSDLVTGLISALFELLFAATGRRLFGLFGRRPHEIACMFTGLAFWMVAGIVAYAVLHH